MCRAGVFLRCAVFLVVLVLISASAWSQERVNPATEVQKQPVSSSIVSGAMVPDAATSVQPTAPMPISEPAQIVLSAGDLLQITVYDAADLKQEVRVSSSGTISFPPLGTVRVTGVTPQQLEQLLAQKLLDGGFFAVHPQVTVFVKEFYSQGISVMGEVNKPSVVPAFSARRLYDVISAAGGMSNHAGRMVTITRRTDPTQPIQVTLAGDPAKSLESNVEIFPGDTVVVARAGIVYVVGDVGRPGGFAMENNDRISVLQAIALAQGANRTAALSHTKIVRRSSGQSEEIDIDLGKILRNKAPDLDLRAEDVVFVPNSAGKSATRTGLAAALQTVVGLSIYRF